MNDIITTAEDLDALPIGSVVRCDDAEGIGLNVAERHKEGWQYVGSSLHFSSTQVASDEVAFTVLHRPDQPTEPARCAPSREGIEAAIQAGVELGYNEQDVAESTGYGSFDGRPLDVLAPIHALAMQILDHFGDEWPHTPACEGEPGCTLCEILWLSAGGGEQPTPVFAAMGLPSVEVPSVGGEQHG